MNTGRMLVIALVVFVCLVIAWAVYDTFFSGPRVNLDAFAQCVRDKGFTMYGAAWCPHCQNEKKAFGSAFQFIPYVECPDTPKLCQDKGVVGFPTWLVSDGRRFQGEQGIKKISEESGCPLPPGA